MNDLIDSFRMEGKIWFNEFASMPPVPTRHNSLPDWYGVPASHPFPKSIYDNVAFGPRAINGYSGNLNDIVEESLHSAALWDEVKIDSRNPLWRSPVANSNACASPGRWRSRPALS